MVFVDTDGDGKKEIVFGTKYNRVYALSAADGAIRWSTVVDDEVTVVKAMTDPSSGEECILVGTDAGTLLKLDCKGKRMGCLSFACGISDLSVLEYPERKRKDIVVSIRGGVVVCNHELQVRASADTGDSEPSPIFPAGREGEIILFYVASQRFVCLLQYQPYFLRPSRDY